MPTHDGLGCGIGACDKATVVLLSCIKSKQPVTSRAENPYTSTLFRKSLAYARSLKPDHIFILSAKHGVLRLEDKIEPYEQTLSTMGVAKRKAWANDVLGRLHHAVLEFGDLAERIERRVGGKISRRLIMAE